MWRTQRAKLRLHCAVHSIVSSGLDLALRVAGDFVVCYCLFASRASSRGKHDMGALS